MSVENKQKSYNKTFVFKAPENLVLYRQTRLKHWKKRIRLFYYLLTINKVALSLSGWIKYLNRPLMASSLFDKVWVTLRLVASLQQGHLVRQMLHKKVPATFLLRGDSASNVATMSPDKPIIALNKHINRCSH